MNAIQSERILNYLKNTPLLEGYCITIYHSSKAIDPDKVNRHLCGTKGIAHLCHKICLPAMHTAVDETLEKGQPVFFRCPLGLFSFSIPVADDACLVCSGMRENLFDLYFYGSEQFEQLKSKQNVHPYEILEQLEKLPVSTEKKVRETMVKVDRLLASFLSGEKVQTAASEENLDSTFLSVAGEIEAMDSIKKATALYGETLGILFDAPLILMVIKDEESNCCMVEKCWGSFAGSCYLSSKKLPFRGGHYVPTILKGEEVMEIFPGSGMSNAICIPLCDGDYLFGMSVIFDVSLSTHALNLVEKLSQQIADKLKKNMAGREASKQKRDVRLLEMIRTLALTESQDDLLKMIMEMSAELVDASSGSLMLLEKCGKILRITSSLGINPHLAKSFSTKVGEGIAGKVAASGNPILITDIEQDMNIGRRNRTRFDTKSCLSLPLRLKGTVIGVLNLADKKNNAPFTRADQDILTTFIDQAIVILEKTTTLKKAILNTISDPLTGLYNLRFIRKRLNEELSRSIRYNLQLSLSIVSVKGNGRSIDGGRSITSGNLKEVARVLNSSLRDIDLIGRFGEEEFCVILPSTPKKEAMLVSDRILRTIRKEMSNGKDEQLSESLAISIGVASFPDDGASPGDIITAARTAVSQAEAEGVNRISSAGTASS